MKDFALLKGEKLVEKIKPLPAFKKYAFLSWCIVAFFFSGFFGIFFAAALFIVGAPEYLVLIFILIFIAGCFGGAWAASKAAYDKAQYWITNKRIIIKQGLIGYQIISIPFERISDIIISRTFFEKLFKISSLHIQSLAGGSAAEGVLLAIPNPEKLQNKILNLVKVKRKKEGLTI